MEPFIGQLGLFAFNFVPRGWIPCDGQELAITQYQSLYSLIGCTFGGNGTTTFAVPDLRGRGALSAGSGPDLTPRALGSSGGQSMVTLTTATTPAHTHTWEGCQVDANTQRPAGTLLAVTAATAPAIYKQNATNRAALHSATLAPAAGGSGHDNRQPFLAMIWAISNTGVWPSRS